MYLWHTAQLREELKNNTLSESAKKNYYIVLSVIALLVMNISILAGGTDATKTVIEAFFEILILIVGVNVTFKTNGGNDYITRVVVLSVPLLIKTYLGMLISAVALGILAFLLKRLDHPSDYWFAFVVSLLFQGFYFWRLNVHLMKMKA